jgi:hypothetical protein
VVIDLRGHSILIIDSEVSGFADRLAATLEHGGAETLVVRDPYSGNGPERIRQFTFSAALVSAEHGSVTANLGMPTVLYTRSEKPEAIVASLERMLGPTPDRDVE